MIKPKLVQLKSNRSISLSKLGFTRFLGRPSLKRSWRLRRGETIVITSVIITVLLLATYGFLVDQTPKQSNTDPQATTDPSPTTEVINATQTPNILKPIDNPMPNPTTPPQPKLPGLIETSPAMTPGVWRQIARNAWNYYTPGSGIDVKTGLPAAAQGYNYFTDWDLGVYIQAIIDARKLNLITTDGTWGSHARLEKIISFLETRPIDNTTGVPYWFYGSDGTGFRTQSSLDIMDTGTLFVALYNAKVFDHDLASRIDGFVHGDRTDYTALVPSIKQMTSSASIYGYYCASGFAFFWPELSNVPTAILNNIYASTVTTPEGVILPKADISCEPLLYSFFNLGTNPKIVGLMNDTYSAHEAKYNSTGRYVAFSEGNGPSGFIWEWVVMTNGETWKVYDGQAFRDDINPIIYSKVSLSFLAIYNSTFARDMCIYLERLLPDPSLRGYSAGADFTDYAGNTVLIEGVDCNTNGLILSAARYALHA